MYAYILLQMKLNVLKLCQVQEKKAKASNMIIRNGLKKLVLLFSLQEK